MFGMLHRFGGVRPLGWPLLAPPLPFFRPPATARAASSFFFFLPKTVHRVSIVINTKCP